MTRNLMGVLVLAIGAATHADTSIDVCFSPGGDCEKRIVREIEGAKQSVRMQAHVFTSRPVADALAAAARRGVKVQAILDASNQKDRFTAAGVLKKAGIEVFVDGKHAVANNKVLVIDGEIVLTGSMNFTKAADDSNAENHVIIRDAALAGRFLDNWEKHIEHSEPMKAAPGGIVERPPRPSGPPAGDPRPASADTKVVITENGKRYHRPDCETLRGGGVEVLIAEAKAKGRTPCRRCKPAE